jgi:geranylgeranyl pyrophosphate synthase
MENELLKAYAAYTDRFAVQFFGSLPKSDLLEVVEYSYTSGGKRLRPAFVLHFCKIYGGDIKYAAPIALAIELIHIFSLIQDDLPIMDNDDIRHGKPTVHKKFGAATALLASDAAVTFAFKLIATSDVPTNIKDELTDAFATYAYAMILGQYMDVKNTGAEYNAEELVKLYQMKTGKLLSLAVQAGIFCADLDEDVEIPVDAIDAFVHAFSMTYQITDDILDVLGEEEKIGRPNGSDKKNAKTTFAELYGVGKAQAIARDYRDKALIALNKIPDDGFLKAITNHLLVRRN